MAAWTWPIVVRCDSEAIRPSSANSLISPVMSIRTLQSIWMQVTTEGHFGVFAKYATRLWKCATGTPSAAERGRKLTPAEMEGEYMSRSSFCHSSFTNDSFTRSLSAL
jgi:hypothetical protein